MTANAYNATVSAFTFSDKVQLVRWGYEESTFFSLTCEPFIKFSTQYYVGSPLLGFHLDYYTQ